MASLPHSRRLSAVASHLVAAAAPAAAAAAAAAAGKDELPSTGGAAIMRANVQQRAGPKTEADVRVELAAAYRFIDHIGWGDGINNHITASIPGQPDEYLINSYGMGFDEVTASSLVKIDVTGNVLNPGTMGGAVNLAGFNIHGAIHRADPSAICVVHTHEVHTAAVASMKCGFLPGLSQHSLLCGEVAHHPYAPTTGRGGEEECNQMATNLLEAFPARIMLLENHGVVTVGETIADAMFRLWYVTKAAEIQVTTLQSVGLEGAIQVTSEDTLRRMSKGGQFFLSGNVADAEFAHNMRVVDRFNPGYNDL